jgi:hypothetical protein
LRQGKTSEKPDFMLINEDLELVFNAVSLSEVIVQRPQIQTSSKLNIQTGLAYEA